MNHLQIAKKQIGVFIRTSFQQEIAFRFNFVAKLGNTFIQLLGSIGGIWILFNVKDSINGWSFYEIMTVTGFFMLLQAIKGLTMAPSLSAISGLDGELWTGQFDFALLKPISTQLYVSMKNWSLFSVFDIGVSLVVLIIAGIQLESTLMGGKVVIFILSLGISVVLLYSIMLILACVAFWYLGTPLLWILDSVMELGRYPVKIYPLAFSNLLTWVVPVGVMVTIPAEALMGKVELMEVLGGGLLAIFAYILAVRFLKISVRKYSSASS